MELAIVSAQPILMAMESLTSQYRGIATKIPTLKYISDIIQTTTASCLLFIVVGTMDNTLFHTLVVVLNIFILALSSIAKIFLSLVLKKLLDNKFNI